MWHSIGADFIVVIHFLFVVFVGAGAFLVMKWRWILYLHIPAATWGALIEFLGLGCPLTPLEKSLRIAAGEEDYAGGFIQHYLVPMIYPGEITREMQIWVGVFVIIINIAIYGWVFMRRGRTKK